MAQTNGNYHHGDLRAALITEAVEMIAEGGVEAVTMREIGRRLGVSRAAPYRHFTDKTELLVAVAGVGFAALARRLEAAGGGQAVAGLGDFRHMGEAYVHFALENPARYRLMYGREALARSEQPELRAAANAIFDRLAELFEAEQRAGRMREQNPKTQAYVAWSAVHGLASLLIDNQILADVDVDALITQTIDTLFEGMGA